MRLAWINPAFSDYRVPVYAELDGLTGGELHVIYSLARTENRVSTRLKERLGTRAVGLSGEAHLQLGGSSESFANVGVRLPFQPGLFRTIRQVKPEVIIGEGFFQWTPAAVLYKFMAGVPLVIAYEKTRHTERNAGRWRLAYRRWVAKKADAFACNGSLSKEFCTSVLGVPEARISTGAMAADSETLARHCSTISAEHRLRFRATLGIDGPLFLFMGRLIQLKGLRELFNAWAVYRDRLQGNGHLVICGDGPERAVLAKAASGDSHIHLVGRVDYAAVAKYYNVCDILIMPSLEDNWSLVVPEAMACARPILCSIYNGCWPELIKDGVNGWAFDPHETLSFAKLMLRCQEHRDSLPAMGTESYRIVQAYSPRKAAEAVLKACRIAIQVHQCKGAFCRRPPIEGEPNRL